MATARPLRFREQCSHARAAKVGRVFHGVSKSACISCGCSGYDAMGTRLRYPAVHIPLGLFSVPCTTYRTHRLRLRAENLCGIGIVGCWDAINGSGTVCWTLLLLSPLRPPTCAPKVCILCSLACMSGAYSLPQPVPLLRAKVVPTADYAGHFSFTGGDCPCGACFGPQTSIAALPFRTVSVLCLRHGLDHEGH
jgi:hypothetical protein